MYLKIGLVLLAAWLLGRLGLFDIGQLLHLLLIGGLMMLLLALATAERAPAGPRK
jgi:hypothetical protein